VVNQMWVPTERSESYSNRKRVPTRRYSRSGLRATHLEHPPRAGSRLLSVVVLLYVAAVPFDLVNLAFGRTLTVPLALILLITWMGVNLRHHFVLAKLGLPELLLFLYVLWITCTAFWTASIDSTLQALPGLWLRAALVGVLINSLPGIWMAALVTLGSSSALLSLAILVGPTNSSRGDRGGLEGVDENVTALVLVVGLACLVFVASHFGIKATAILAVPLAVIGGAVLRLGSRTGAIAAAAVIVVAILSSTGLKSGSARAWVRALGIVMLACSTLIFANNKGFIPERVLDLFSENGSFDDSGRSMIIELYLRTVDKWALFGVGFGADSTYLGQTQSVALNAHSLFWKTWVEAGLVGLALFLGLLLVVVNRGRGCVCPRAFMILAVPVATFAVTLGGVSTSAFWFVIAFALTPGVPTMQPWQGRRTPLSHLQPRLAALGGDTKL